MKEAANTVWRNLLPEVVVEPLVQKAKANCQPLADKDFFDLCQTKICQPDPDFATRAWESGVLRAIDIAAFEFRNIWQDLLQS